MRHQPTRAGLPARRGSARVRALVTAGLLGLVAGPTLAGCGSSSSPATAASAGTASASARTGTASTSDVTAAASALPPASKMKSESYGALPTYLPRDQPGGDAVLVGTAARPALTTEGDAVKASLPGGATATMTVTGPEVPGEGLPDAPETAPCTWTVTVSQASAPVRIDLADFSTLDHLGNVNHPALIKGRPAPPTTLAPGRSVTFEVRATMIVGEGLMRWSPGGRDTVASWDFEVEND